MKIGLSPCPNDTYLFYPWIAGHVGEKITPIPCFADIQCLNEWALNHHFPLIKVSIHCFADLLDTYQLLPVGAALGYNCGPKIIAKKKFKLSEISSKRIAIPGKNTTAHCLFNYFFPEFIEKYFCLYDQILDALENNLADCGIIIHETRFTYAEKGYFEIVDLGELWENETHSPLPLGGLAISRNVPDSIKCEVVKILRSSLKFSQANPEKALPFILRYCQEKDPQIAKQHIATFISSETERLTSIGVKAIHTLLGCPKSGDWLYSEE